MHIEKQAQKDTGTPANPLTNKQASCKGLNFLRHREIAFSPVRLARYALALNAMCTDPRQFHGHDLIGTLQHHEPPTDYEFALTTLATCNAQAHVRKRQIRRLLDIANAAQDHNVGEALTIASISRFGRISSSFKYLFYCLSRHRRDGHPGLKVYRARPQAPKSPSLCPQAVDWLGAAAKARR